MNTPVGFGGWDALDSLGRDVTKEEGIHVVLKISLWHSGTKRVSAWSSLQSHDTGEGRLHVSTEGYAEVGGVPRPVSEAEPHRLMFHFTLSQLPILLLSNPENHVVVTW